MTNYLDLDGFLLLLNCIDSFYYFCLVLMVLLLFPWELYCFSLVWRLYYFSFEGCITSLDGYTTFLWGLYYFFFEDCITFALYWLLYYFSSEGYITFPLRFYYFSDVSYQFSALFIKEKKKKKKKKCSCYCSFWIFFPGLWYDFYDDYMFYLMQP